MNSKLLQAEPVHIGAFVPRALRERLAERAAQQERSVSAELRVAIREHLDGDKDERTS
jgi:plasmid stability protein